MGERGRSTLSRGCPQGVQGTQATPHCGPQSGLPPLEAPSKAVGRRLTHTLGLPLSEPRSWQPSLP